MSQELAPDQQANRQQKARRLGKGVLTFADHFAQDLSRQATFGRLGSNWREDASPRATDPTESQTENIQQPESDKH